jgi:superfamily II DNA or RNA helicase
MATAIAKRMARTEDVLVVTHRIELVDQAAEAFAKAFGASVRVHTIQGMLAQASFPKAKLLIIDEAHHIKAETWQEIPKRYEKAKVLGLTATPQRGDGKALGDIFQALVEGPQTIDLVRAGVLVPSVCYVPQKDKKKRLASRILDAIKTYAIDRSAIVYVDDIATAEREAIALNGARLTHFGKAVRACAIHSKLNDEVRRRILDDFKSGTTQVLFNCQVLTEGFDAPTCSAIIIARSIGTEGTYLQIVGRGLRKPSIGEKKDCVVVDMVGDATNSFGLPEDERAFSLEGRPIRDKSIGIEFVVCTCEKCGRCFQARNANAIVCPECKFSPPKQEREILWRNYTLMQGAVTSLTHPNLVAEWSTRNVCSIDDARTAEKYWWQCANGHTWQATLNGRKRGN